MRTDGEMDAGTKRSIKIGREMKWEKVAGFERY